MLYKIYVDNCTVIAPYSLKLTSNIDVTLDNVQANGVDTVVTLDKVPQKSSNTSMTVRNSCFYGHETLNSSTPTNRHFLKGSTEYFKTSFSFPIFYSCLTSKKVR
ncbi:hypothetical protein [Neisseria perflava]|uniref:hypothetical protein n=1 Tax=Neisseria perflava TaxID=33053 RepID=UPI00209D0501|nr:hypothetical protein [Neisseria perflava]MCP1659249.1 hypothetical protein [Neisseria perflava]MCP1773157.1 hypothetical protein [Neisseria perflava]